MARSMGVEATVVNSHREISEAVETALKTGKAHLIEIPVTGVTVDRLQALSTRWTASDRRCLGGPDISQLGTDGTSAARSDSMTP